jgi:hypothetical protein
MSHSLFPSSQSLPIGDWCDQKPTYDFAIFLLGLVDTSVQVCAFDVARRWNCLFSQRPSLALVLLKGMPERR